jgi:hypothetical protein
MSQYLVWEAGRLYKYVRIYKSKSSGHLTNSKKPSGLHFHLITAYGSILDGNVEVICIRQQTGIQSVC